MFNPVNIIKKAIRTLLLKIPTFHLQIFSKAKGLKMAAKTKITWKVIEKKIDSPVFRNLKRSFSA